MRKRKQKKIREFGYSFVRPLLKVFTVLFLNPRTIGRKNIPKEGGMIFAGNHLGLCDVYLVGNAISRPLHFLAKKELMDVFIFGSILRWMGVIRVDRESKDKTEVKSEALQVLNEDKVLCLFPEGTTKKKAKVIIKPFKYGAVSFAYKSGKPIVPFALISKPKLFHYKTTIVIGKPFYVKSDDLEKENEKFENLVKDMIIQGGKKYGK